MAQSQPLLGGLEQFYGRYKLAVIVNNDIRQMNKLTTSLFSELNCN
jgi:hypothetical protein